MFFTVTAIKLSTLTLPLFLGICFLNLNPNFYLMTLDNFQGSSTCMVELTGQSCGSDKEKRDVIGKCLNVKELFYKHHPQISSVSAQSIPLPSHIKHTPFTPQKQHAEPADEHFTSEHTRKLRPP